ncbi:hypothetical protein [Legionella shakespearei]|uniref:Uncharacterized protein n=1 Tax=Legionella shakespearei DSM 23087 TaxID=1122169 RepID=A0A0W0YL75_9GAMM|nr:hypothetical protein [Legionella shakespearei]KTD57658.1 hypothetical protein Lsha_2499 [Legionella shakespearei DSM 23087]
MPEPIISNEQKLAKLVVLKVLDKLGEGIEKTDVNLVLEQIPEPNVMVCALDLGQKSQDEVIAIRSKLWKALESITGSKIDNITMETPDKHFMTKPAHWTIKIRVDELIKHYPSLFNSLLSNAFSYDEQQTLEPRFKVNGMEMGDFEIVTKLMGQDEAEQLASQLRSELPNHDIYASVSRNVQDRYRVIIPHGVQLIEKAMDARQNSAEKSLRFFQTDSASVSHSGEVPAPDSFTKK